MDIDLVSLSTRISKSSTITVADKLAVLRRSLAHMLHGLPGLCYSIFHTRTCPQVVCVSGLAAGMSGQLFEMLSLIQIHWWLLLSISQSPEPPQAAVDLSPPPPRGSPMPVFNILAIESQTAYLKAGKCHQLSCFLPCWKPTLFFKKPTTHLKKKKIWALGCCFKLPLLAASRV